MLIVRYIGPIWGGLVIFVLWGLAVLTAFGLWHPLENWLLQQAGLPAGADLASALAGVLASENPVIVAAPGR